MIKYPWKVTVVAVALKEGHYMNENNTVFQSEYNDILNFINEQQEAALQYSDTLLSEKKEIEYRKKQQEYMLKEQEKNRIPNISMLSPLDSDEFTEDDVAWKDELLHLNEKQQKLEDAWNKQKQVCISLERLKNYIINTEKNDNSLSNYSIKLLETQEMDRNRISRELHDSTVQSLTSLGHKMEYCSKLIDKDPVRVKLELQSMIELNKEIINGMREIIYDMRPMSLDNTGLVSTVEAFCLHIRRYNNFDVLLKTRGQEKELSYIVSVTLYRIIQEACNNAVRHSHAEKVVVSINFENDSVRIDIEDNGVGFNIEKTNERTQKDVLNGFGLSTMKERARLLSGSLTIESKPGCGTKVSVVVPDIGTYNS